MGEGKAIISGTVAAGLGEGAHFMSMGHYKKEIKNKLGFGAYPGTLNVKIGKTQSNLLKNLSKIKINGFEKDGKKFGSASCWKAKIQDITGAIIMPEINKHKGDIIEFIAPVKIKPKLNINNGDKIEIELL